MARYTMVKDRLENICRNKNHCVSFSNNGDKREMAK